MPDTQWEYRGRSRYSWHSFSISFAFLFSAVLQAFHCGESYFSLHKRTASGGFPPTSSHAAKSVKCVYGGGINCLVPGFAEEQAQHGALVYRLAVVLMTLYHIFSPTFSSHSFPVPTPPLFSRVVPIDWFINTMYNAAPHSHAVQILILDEVQLIRCRLG